MPETSDSATGPVFFISPIRTEGSPERTRSNRLLKAIIRPVLDEVGLQVVRADEVADPGQITSDMVTRIIGARFIVADMATMNPNVFYEIGLADAFLKPVIAIGQDGESPPFDVRNRRSLTVATGTTGKLDFEEAATKQKAFRDLVATVLSEGHQVTSIVTEAGAKDALSQLGAAEPKNLTQLVMLDLIQRTDDLLKLNEARANSIQLDTGDPSPEVVAVHRALSPYVMELKLRSVGRNTYELYGTEGPIETSTELQARIDGLGELLGLDLANHLLDF